MYEEYFKLKERPFSISPDPRFIYLTDQHSEALAKCEYAISQKMGLSVIYGDIGAGKTTLARRLWEKYGHHEKYNFAMMVDPNYPSLYQFIHEVRREFDILNPRRSLGDAMEEFRGYLLEQHNKGKTTVLVVDEAQTLKNRIYELLRQILNFETNTEKLLQIVLFGQNELVTRIDRVPALKDRVTIFGSLTALTEQDTKDLIRFRWNIAGGKELPFSEEALRAIYIFSKGSPRKLCKLCDNALIAAFSKEITSIDKNVIEEIACEIRLVEDSAEQTSTNENTPHKTEEAPDLSDNPENTETTEEHRETEVQEEQGGERHEEENTEHPTESYSDTEEQPQQESAHYEPQPVEHGDYRH